MLLTGVEAASWGRAGTCGHRASVPGPGHRHLMNTLQEQGLIVPMAQGGALLETPSAAPLLLGMLGKLELSSFVKSKSTRGCLGTVTRTGLLQGTGSLRAPGYPKPLTVLQQPARHKEPWQMLAGPGQVSSGHPPRLLIQPTRDESGSISKKMFPVEEPQSSRPDRHHPPPGLLILHPWTPSPAHGCHPPAPDSLSSSPMPSPSPGLTLQLIDAAVINALSRFPLQLLQVLLVLTHRAPVKVLHDLVKLPQQLTELLSHRWGQHGDVGVPTGQAGPARAP